MKKLINKFTMASLFFCACGGNSTEGVDSLSLDYFEDNGVTLNGVTLNGVTLNGVTLNGVTLNGVTLNGSALTGNLKDAPTPVSGADFSGALVPGSLSNGTTALARIDSAAYSTTSGFYTYTVSLQHDAGWAPICGTANGSAVPAVLVPGTWDLATGTQSDGSAAFTFACINAAIGKCVTWGYRPWETKTECSGKDCRTQSLGNWLDACTRLVRADYCGDGTPHTRNGTPINVWDPLGIQLQAPTSWELEAEWASDGAHCIKHTRWVNADPTKIATATDLDYVTMNCRHRLAQNDKDNCGSNSSFPSKNGLWISTEKRNLLRNQSALNR